MDEKERLDIYNMLSNKAKDEYMKMLNDHRKSEYDLAENNKIEQIEFFNKYKIGYVDKLKNLEAKYKNIKDLFMSNLYELEKINTDNDDYQIKNLINIQHKYLKQMNDNLFDQIILKKYR